MAFVGACGSDTSRDDVSGGAAMSGDGGPGMGSGGGTGMGALGGSAKTVLLAEGAVESLPAGPLAWSAFVVKNVEHEHAAGFVHAIDATSLRLGRRSQQLGRGEAMFVPASTPHAHGPGTAWDVLLVAPGAQPPVGAGRDAVFRSGQLEGLPSGDAQLRTLLVELPPGTETSIHTHPGPEYIYGTGGGFFYENAIIGEAETGKGDHHTLPAGVPVQKRNAAGSEVASFLSWFVVERDKPFAPSATFDR